MEQNKNTPDNETSIFKHKLMNICVLVFTLVLTAITLVAFFAAILSSGNDSGYAIATIYILCMLLAAPTLKGFLERIGNPFYKRLNTIAIIAVFTSILIVTLVSVMTLAFPQG